MNSILNNLFDFNMLNFSYSSFAFVDLDISLLSYSSYYFINSAYKNSIINSSSNTSNMIDKSIQTDLISLIDKGSDIIMVDKKDNSHDYLLNQAVQTESINLIDKNIQTNTNSTIDKGIYMGCGRIYVGNR